MTYNILHFITLKNIAYLAIFNIVKKFSPCLYKPKIRLKLFILTTSLTFNEVYKAMDSGKQMVFAASNVRQIRDQLRKSQSTDLVLDDASEEGSLEYGNEYGGILGKPKPPADTAPTVFPNKRRIAKGKCIKQENSQSPPTSAVSPTFLTDSIPKETPLNDLQANPIVQTELEDFDNDEIEPLAPPLVQCTKPCPTIQKIVGKPIEVQTARDLRRLLLKSSSVCWSAEWVEQDIAFNEEPKLLYGIVQRKGGPCGALAAIQAWLLYYLLFSEMSGDSMRSERLRNPVLIKKSLIKAILHMIWSAGEGRTGSVCIKGRTPHIPSTVNLPHDSITEKLNIHTCKNINELESYIEQHIDSFIAEGGVLLIIYSVILSRSIRTVKRDMDEVDKCLIASHNYCSQELVNLLLTGRACSNTFNDNKSLDDLILKGIDQRQIIGMLSLFDHYRSVEVGSYLKTPKSPIWLICSESHYSVLFSTNKALVNDWKAERFFDLFYYDGLSNQLNEIRLTIITTEKNYVPPEKEGEELVPPLELCIRTKWKDARVEWNDSTPIL
ncbi:DgyrCDS468 [Dimorphilus gyrociliatus]|uniref:Ubiquitin carboxyl-terminal hydrolase MINDY n=1 Tax=Dimorphilus gyrociliatus TaxID=2664684 RepID=A0A7I8V6H1_9ANNE|nr:DgyrCDS468 [Dimorphilus gyrociliatus]